MALNSAWLPSHGIKFCVASEPWKTLVEHSGDEAGSSLDGVCNFTIIPSDKTLHVTVSYNGRNPALFGKDVRIVTTGLDGTVHKANKSQSMWNGDTNQLNVDFALKPRFRSWQFQTRSYETASFPPIELNPREGD